MLPGSAIGACSVMQVRAQKHSLIPCTETERKENAKTEGGHDQEHAPRQKLRYLSCQYLLEIPGEAVLSPCHLADA